MSVKPQSPPVKSIMYLEKFVLPADENDVFLKRYYKNGCYVDNEYPIGIFNALELAELDFEKVTLLCGGNGCGKSTLLNLIAHKLKLKRFAPFNGSETFAEFAADCSVRLWTNEEGKTPGIPRGSAIITSDDVFEYMLSVREANNGLRADKPRALEEFGKLARTPMMKLSGLSDEELFAFKKQLEAKRAARRRGSVRKYLKKTLGEETRLFSNGETALIYFEEKLQYDNLYLLDEPENSLSPLMQLQLKEMLERLSRYCGCQFIIATHSPFLAALEGAKIYDMSVVPVDVRKWWQLSSSRTYFEFFHKHRDLFL